MVAVDAAEAGIGDWVLVVSGGGASFDVLGFDAGVPLREVVVGIIDRIEMIEAANKTAAISPNTEKLP